VVAQHSGSTVARIRAKVRAAGHWLSMTGYAMVFVMHCTQMQDYTTSPHFVTNILLYPVILS